MSWCNKALGLVLLLCVAACGFDPLYGGPQVVAAQLPGMEINNIPDRDGQYFRNQMIDRLYARGMPQNAPYALNFSPVDKNIVNIGIQKDATATRAQLQVSTQMTLTDKATGNVLLQRNLKATDAYNILDNQLATLVSQQSATESVLNEMADSALNELSLYFKRAALP